MAINPRDYLAILADADPKTLAHYGVKGMKWGVRRTPAQLARASGGKKSGGPDLVRTKDNPGGRATAKGGSRYRNSEDAKTTAARKQIAKESTTDALTTKQLKAVVERMNLEQQYNKLNPPKVSAGKAFVKAVIENDKAKLAKTGDYKETSTYKLGKTAVDVISIGVKAAKKK